MNMGLLSHYIAYKFGKRRVSKQYERSSQQEAKDQRCIDYHYCKARGGCPDLLSCTYE